MSVCFRRAGAQRAWLVWSPRGQRRTGPSFFLWRRKCLSRHLRLSHGPLSRVRSLCAKRGAEECERDCCRPLEPSVCVCVFAHLCLCFVSDCASMFVKVKLQDGFIVNVGWRSTLSRGTHLNVQIWPCFLTYLTAQRSV